jgi:thioredoxin
MKFTFKNCAWLVLVLLTACASPKNGNEKLNAGDFQKELNNTSNKILLDVRTPEEFAEGHLSGALNIDYNSDDFQKQISALDKEKTVFVYCLSGSRSEKAADILAKNKFNSIYQMDGGILAWQKNGLPITMDESRSNVVASDKISTSQFDEYLKKGKNVLVDYNATWCAPCKMQTPIVEEIAEQMGDDLIFLSIDVDKNMELARAQNIEALPTLVVYKNGKQSWKNIGFTEKNIILNALKD